MKHQQIREMREAFLELKDCGFECEAGSIEGSIAFQTIHQHLCCMDCVEKPKLCNVCQAEGHCKHCIIGEEFCGLKIVKDTNETESMPERDDIGTVDKNYKPEEKQ